MKFLSCASRGRNPDNPKERGKSNGQYRQTIEININKVSNTITTVQKDYLMFEVLPAVLTPVRTEFGKAVRKEYDSHKVKFKRQEMREWVPRKDGVSNTMSTVTKDNTLMEDNKVGGKLITAEIAEQLKLPKEYIGKRFRIRKLTPRECFRLMDVDEENINKLLNAKNEKGQQLISNSQLYKLAGNSIVVSCMEYMFRNLFIETPKEDKKSIQLNLF